MSRSKPLPLSDTLRDLALLRSSDLDLSSLLPPTSAEANSSSDALKKSKSEKVETSVQKSYEFAKEARSAIKILNRGFVDSAGESLESLRTKLEDILKGLPSE
jgi:hypothetical protein